MLKQFWVRIGVIWMALAGLVPTVGTAQNNMEFRATWVIDYQWMSSGSMEEIKARIREILDNHKAANMNAVLLQVRRWGNVLYPSQYEPFGAAAGFKSPGFDPLAYAIAEAHKRGLELHAWMNVFETRNLYDGSPGAVNPDWICRDQDGHVMPAEIAWLSPGLAEVREYLVNVAMEIVRNYDIDGLHLDFVRWNEHTSSQTAVQLAKRAQELGLPDGVITDEQLAELQRNAAGRFLYDVQHPYSAGVPSGFGSWEEWWRWSVTEFVRTLHDSIQAVKPWVRLSPAALGRYNWGGWNGYNIVYQDAALWFNEGYIEQIIGMHYHWTRPDEFLSILVNGCPQCWSQYIQPGIQAGRLYSVGLPSWVFSDRAIWKNHESVIKAVRRVNWVDGFQFFSYEDWETENAWEDAANTFFPSKTKIRPIQPGKPPFGAPSLQLTRVDSLTYRIVVESPADAGEAHWLAIYRSEDTQIDLDNDDIVDLFFGMGPHEYLEQFDGLQDFNGQYTYFATALDRYWRESDPSNAETSAVIPSFAPTVVSTYPSDQDTVPVDVTVRIRFSKTMDATATAAAVQWQPQISGYTVQWSADGKEMTLSPDADLAFDTQYVIIIQPQARDINGRALDGNGDGQEGDAYQWTFYTEPKDVTGPVVLTSFPAAGDTTREVDVADILSVAFDELIDGATVAKNEIQLLLNDSPVDFAFQITHLDERSVLGIQPTRYFDPNSLYQLRFDGDVADVNGNVAQNQLEAVFRTSDQVYTFESYIDKFFTATNWWQPHESGSTTGAIRQGTSFAISSKSYLPTASLRQRTSAALRYEWDPNASDHLIRVFLAGGSPREVTFDTTFVLQCYLFSDGSGNLFRFAVDDSTKDQAAFHEVSQWIKLDWYGWRLVEWQLNDPNSVGQWIGDGVLNGPSLRIDSFQMTYVPGAATKGVIYIDNLRLVKKESVPVAVAETAAPPVAYRLHQNYPNPFNPETIIAFELPKTTRVVLSVYDLLGRKIATLVDDVLPGGSHRVLFRPHDLASGTYYYVLEADGQRLMRSMTLMK